VRQIRLLSKNFLDEDKRGIFDEEYEAIRRALLLKAELMSSRKNELMKDLLPSHDNETELVLPELQELKKSVDRADKIDDFLKATESALLKIIRIFSNLAIVFGLLISLENNSSESQENGVNIEEARAILITLEREMREVEQKIRESREQLHSFLRWKKIKYNPHDNQSVVLFRQIHSREKLEYPYATIGAELKFVQSLSRDENSLLTESVYQTEVMVKNMSVTY
jgi:hypothetical protein